MSSFKSCSDEDIKAIFCHLEFPTNCRLRRCSRRWNHLLRSDNVLRTVIFPLSFRRDLDRTGFFRRRETAFIQAQAVMQTSLPFLVNFVLIGDSVHRSLNQHMTKFLYSLPWEKTTKRQHECRLFLCSLEVEAYFLDSMCKIAVFDWIISQNMTLSGEAVRCTLIETLRECKRFDNYDLPLRTRNSSRLAVELTGSYVFKRPSDVIELSTLLGMHMLTKPPTAVVFGLIKDHMRHLDQPETRYMLDILRYYDADRVQAAFIWLLKVYEPDFARFTDPYWETFDYRLCSPFVGRLLACYDEAEVDGDDSAEEAEDSDLGGDGSMEDEGSTCSDLEDDDNM